MASEDMDRQDRLERVAAGARITEEMAQMDPDDFFQSPYLKTVLRARAFSSEGTDLGKIIRAAKKHNNSTLHTVARTVAALGMKNTTDPDTKERYRQLVETPFEP